MGVESPLALGTGSSVVVERCQVCEAPELEPVLFLGYLPPVNLMPEIGKPLGEQPSFPARLLRCPRCQLVQLGLIVDPRILFPPDYPYTSGTTKILRDNFAALAQECRTVLALGPEDLVVDIGSNDGTLLGNFAGRHRVLGIEPTDVGRLADARGIPTLQAFFDRDTARRARAEHGPARVITATNVFAHIEQVHEVVEAILSLLDETGVFVSESHYFPSLVETLQYDTIYHEHLRYYSLHSLQFLLQMHGLEVIHATRIPTHGGSVRVYAARAGALPVRDTVQALLAHEARTALDAGSLRAFRERVVRAKLELYGLLLEIKRRGERVVGIAAPSRASTLINYVGLDDGILDYVVEVKGSHKIGRYIPGTLIPVVEESRLFEEQPPYALVLSWHIAEELTPKLTRQGYRGAYVIPLPTPRVWTGGE
ncbi:MAG: class I SAM-dependent methyltransferase [Candidatus Rokubacteria bacterium]|nr:class I SAM-dependent methyltransferase [Candidatus Rokubacteria bacterium]